MKNTPFVIERVYHADVSKVWKAITNKADMKQWYFDLAEFRPEVGFEFSFYGEGRQGQKYLHHCRITDVEENRKLRYSWAYEGMTGISYVTFELFEEGDHTRLKLTHDGLETFPAGNPDFSRESFESGWTEITGKMLKEFVERL